MVWLRRIIALSLALFFIILFIPMLVIIIDAVKGASEPGAIYRFSPDDIRMQKRHLTSAHQVSLLDTLAMAKFAGCSPRDVIIYGIEPKRLDWGIELSPEVAAVVPKVMELIMSEL